MRPRAKMLLEPSASARGASPSPQREPLPARDGVCPVFSEDERRPHPDHSLCSGGRVMTEAGWMNESTKEPEQNSFLVSPSPLQRARTDPRPDDRWRDGLALCGLQWRERRCL